MRKNPMGVHALPDKSYLRKTRPKTISRACNKMPTRFIRRDAKPPKIRGVPADHHTSVSPKNDAVDTTWTAINTAFDRSSSGTAGVGYYYGSSEFYTYNSKYIYNSDFASSGSMMFHSKTALSHRKTACDTLDPVAHNAKVCPCVNCALERGDISLKEDS